MTFQNSESLVAPYRILFPLGWLHAVIGAWVWVVYSLGFGAYPSVPHVHHMISGFLFSYAMGFLLTAVPRFTGTRSATHLELSISVCLSITSLLSSHPILPLLSLIFISYFFGARIRHREYSPPPHFIFIPIGIGLGIIGATIQLGSYMSITVFDGLLVPARLLLYYGTMLSLLVGIGAKMVGALLGWQRPPQHQIQPIHDRNSKIFSKNNKWLIPLVLALIFILSFVLEIFEWIYLGRTLRALVGSWIAVVNWKILKKPLAHGRLAFWLWITACFFIIGLWVHAFSAEYSVHAAHLIFLCGFGMMTLLVASRVVLAHGSYPLEIETHSKAYPWITGLVITTALTRVTAIFTTSYVNHLGYAAVLWISALLIWGFVFLPKIQKQYKEFTHKKEV